MNFLKNLLPLLAIAWASHCSNQEPDVFPKMIENGIKRVQKLGRTGKNGQWEVYLDTTILSKGEIYRSQRASHPLDPFGIPYEKWATTACRIAIDEGDFWNKYQIAILENSSRLWVKVGGQDIFLQPEKKVKIRADEWSQIFKNGDSRLQLSTHFKTGKIMRSLVGDGTITGFVQNVPVNETAFFVAEEKN